MPSEDDKTYFDEGEYFVGGKSNYDKLPGGYNFLRRSLFWMGKIKRILKYKKSGKMLDIGCAYGFLLYFMKNQFEIYGCDISPHAISQCKKLYRKNREECFFVHDITKPLPYPENYFDVVVCQDVLEHIPNLKQSLEYIQIRNMF
jgi:2-polyprenyl-3-methyl-5-hydroxy-6-metoxy-1,4-benzoquinol methylase